MDVKALFGSRLKQFRKAAGFSQEELAEKVNISIGHLSAMERGLAFVSAELLARLAASLGAPVAAFFCNEDEKVMNNGFFCTLDAILEQNLQQAREQIQSYLRRSS
jgi:repressor LexA